MVLIVFNRNQLRFDLMVRSLHYLLQGKLIKMILSKCVYENKHSGK